jgi:hypothetical protein
MPSTDTKPELTAKASVAQPVSQPAVYANGLSIFKDCMIENPLLSSVSLTRRLLQILKKVRVVWDFSDNILDLRLVMVRQ